MSDETPDNGANKSAFVFPERPEDAVILLTILVEAGEGDPLKLSAQIFPGDRFWDHQAVEKIFRDARTAPQPGIYVFEANNFDVCCVSGPEEVSIREARDLTWFLAPILREARDQLVQALEAFPSAEVITDAARRVINVVSMDSLERGMLLDSTPAADARSVPVEGVRCAHCGLFFGTRMIFNEVFDDHGQKRSTMKVAIKNRDGSPVVLAGYLTHHSDFAAFLNGILAERLSVAIQALTVEVMTEVLVNTGLNLRLGNRIIDAIQMTFQVDPATILARIDAIEADARAVSVPPTEADSDGNDGDGDDEVIGEELSGEPNMAPAD